MKGRVWMLTGCGKGGNKAKDGIREEKFMNLFRTTCFMGMGGRLPSFQEVDGRFP
jgi:hypothetical protein